MTQFLKTYIINCDGDVIFQKKGENNFELSFVAVHVQIRKIYSQASMDPK